MSLEEEQARQRTTEGSSGSQAPALPTVSEASESSASAPAPGTGPAATAPGLPGSGSMVMQGAEPITGEGTGAHNDSEEEMLQKAIALSQAGASSLHKEEDVDMTTAEASEAPRAVVAGQAEGDEDEEMDEDEAIARAIQMSLQESDDQDTSTN